MGGAYTCRRAYKWGELIRGGGAYKWGELVRGGGAYKCGELKRGEWLISRGSLYVGSGAYKQQFTVPGLKTLHTKKQRSQNNRA